MYSLSTEIFFEAGHYLELPGGKKEQTHRHEWRVQATLDPVDLDDYELVIDFDRLQQQLREIVEPMRQADAINDLPEFANINPSTERIARYIYDRLLEQLPGRIKLKEVQVWETPHCHVGYRRS